MDVVGVPGLFPAGIASASAMVTLVTACLVLDMVLLGGSSRIGPAAGYAGWNACIEVGRCSGARPPVISMLTREQYNKLHRRSSFDCGSHGTAILLRWDQRCHRRTEPCGTPSGMGGRVGWSLMEARIDDGGMSSCCIIGSTLDDLTTYHKA